MHYDINGNERLQLFHLHLCQNWHETCCNCTNINVNISIISLGGDETLHVELEANSVDRWPHKELRSLNRSDMVKWPPIPHLQKNWKNKCVLKMHYKQFPVFWAIIFLNGKIVRFWHCACQVNLRRYTFKVQRNQSTHL